MGEEDVALLGTWTPWVAFGDALSTAPAEPGVYLAREGTTKQIVYVGMAGERRGLSNTGKPKGLRGRLSVYARGKALASGLGEAVLDRALADSGWLRERLNEVDAGQAHRAQTWGRLAFDRARLEIQWCTTPDRASARALELAVLAALADTDLWNRAR